MYFQFADFFYFFLLLLLPCFIWCREKNSIYYFPKTEWVSKQHILFSWETWIKIVIFSLMVTALAQPFSYDAVDNPHRKGRDLVLAIDASGSMAQSGFDSKERLKSKFDTNIDLASDFLKKRFDDNVGVVIFGTFAYTASPLSYDVNALQYLLKMTSVGMAGENTAIGDAIMQALRTLSYGEAKNKAIILLSDGYHNAGETSPKKAVAQAKKNGVKIYTIGIGNKSDYDAALLDTIAKETGAKSFSATSAEDLRSIYKTIDTLEPSAIRSENYLNQQLLIIFPLGLAFLLLLVWTLWIERQKL